MKTFKLFLVSSLLMFFMRLSYAQPKALGCSGQLQNYEKSGCCW